MEETYVQTGSFSMIVMEDLCDGGGVTVEGGFNKVQRIHLRRVSSR